MTSPSPAAATPTPPMGLGRQGPERERRLRARARAVRRLRRERFGLLRTLGRDNRMFPRKLVITRQGRWIIGVAILLGGGAVNTGNNLLYLVLSLLMSIIAISGVLSELDLRKLRVRRAPLREIEAGAPTLLRYEVENRKGRAAFHLEVDEHLADDDLDQRAGLLLHVNAHDQATCFAVVRAGRRGPIATLGLQISTTYPFGFARKSLVVEAPLRLLALPPVAAVDVDLGGGRGHGELERSPRAGQGSELRGLRDFRPGDPARDLHWKVSARRGRLIAREWESEAARVLWVEFLHLAPAAGDDPRQLDGACATVAGVCHALLAQGRAVGLRTLQGTVAPAAAQEGGQLLQLRRLLAQLTPADRPPPAEWPLDDDAWLQRCDQASHLAAVVAAGGALGFGGGFGGTAAGAAMPGDGPTPLFAAGDRVVVRFASHAHVPLAGSPPARLVWLDDAGAIAAVEAPAAALPGAA